MQNESYFTMPISNQIWGMKYQLKNFDETPIDLDVRDTWNRIADALSQNEEDSAKRKMEFYDSLENFKFLPAGRITAGAGTDRNVTLFNCFVMGTIPDSMNGIFDMLKEAALTMQQGGGIGYDFSTIRPKGTEVKGVAADASGPLSFMDVWDAMCRTVMSAGSRRGAMMATMRCDHPDIEDYIVAKHDAARLRMFNMSVLITDSFMDAVKSDSMWDLVWQGKVHKSMKARDLWNAIMKSTYDAAEPGVIFIDRINQMNNLNYCETIAATNPCGEQPLPPYGACLLGSINLAQLVVDPFTDDAKIDYYLLEKTVMNAIRMLDNVIDVSKFPLPEQEAEAKAKRRIGLGVTGVADMLMMVGLRYGTSEAESYFDSVMEEFTCCAYMASIELAKEKGPFPLYDEEEFLKSGFINAYHFPEQLRNLIKEHGIRNALVTSIAPTGTISLYANNVSSGIEPVFAYSYMRKVLQKDGSKTEDLVEDFAVAKFRDFWKKNIFIPSHGGMDEEFSDRCLPDYFVNAQTLDPSDHIRMQAVAQKWIDSSISKTVNCPEDITFEDFKQIYMDAYDLGCKGCTTYRPNDITGSVLTVVEKPKEKPDVVAKEPVIKKTIPELPERPSSLHGTTYKLKWPTSDHALYITINDKIVDNVSSPFEIFINSKNTEHFAWMVALTRMVSAVFRRGGDVSFVAEELRAVFDPNGGAWVKGKYYPSMIASIGDVIQQHLQVLSGANPDTLVTNDAVESISIQDNKHPSPPSQCPTCSEFAMIVQSGCPTCTNCGYSKCG